MKKQHIFLFFISFFLQTHMFAQEQEQEQEKKITQWDTLPPSQKYGLRVGIDIAKLVRTSVNENYTGLELLGDLRVYRDFYAAVEVGNESLLRDEENINVEGSGNYIRIGFDYNSYDNWYGMQNSIYVGLRYSFATFSQELQEYNIYTSSQYFETITRTEPIEVKGLTASWIELILGIKAELFYNLYIGANVSLRRMLNEKEPDTFDNLFIPGFGRTNDFSQFGIGYGYTITYLIPFLKKKK